MGFCIFHPEPHLLQIGILEVASRIFDSIPANSSQSDGPGLTGEGETRCEVGTAPHQPVPSGRLAVRQATILARLVLPCDLLFLGYDH